MKYEFSGEQIESTEQTEFLDNGILLEHIGFPSELLEIIEPGEVSDSLWGDPESDAENWHLQSEPMSCAVSCQEFILEQLTETEYQEGALINYAEKRGWYDPETGTSIRDVGKILEDAGLIVERGERYTLNDLAEELGGGGKIICGVNNRILQNPMYSLVPGLRANHAVQVSGIDASDPNNVEVILNDPGVSNGRGLRVSADTFMKAWDTGDNFTVFARKGVAV